MNKKDDKIRITVSALWVLCLANLPQTVGRVSPRRKDKVTLPPCHTSTSPALGCNHLGTPLFGAAGPGRSGGCRGPVEHPSSHLNPRWRLHTGGEPGSHAASECEAVLCLPCLPDLLQKKKRKKAAVAPASSLTSSRGGSPALRSRRGWDRASGEERGCCPGGTASRARGPHDPALPAPQRSQPLTRRRPLPAKSAHGAGEHRRGLPEDGAAGRLGC